MTISELERQLAQKKKEAAEIREKPQKAYEFLNKSAKNVGGV